MKLIYRSFWLAILLLVGVPPILLFIATKTETRARPHLGNVAGVEAAHARWRQGYLVRGGDRNVGMPLGWSEGLSAEKTAARGVARFDFVTGMVRVEVSGLTDPAIRDVWLVDDQPLPEDSIAPQPGDRMMKIGRLHRQGSKARLTAFLGRDFFADFEVDQMVITRAGIAPHEAGVLFGSLGLFERLEQQQRLAAARARGPVGPAGWLATLLSPPPAFASLFFNPDPFDPLVSEGAKLFFNEDFNGNGRTCGTCHPAENNFTVDPDFIATLPKTDLLFIAEFPQPNPLSENFEKPKLMRGVGLILENVDGTDDLKNVFTMRGVPHTLALNTSITPDREDCPDFADATGWSCDGSTDDGSLRLFAKGAVFQHFPKTLARDHAPPPFVVPDFRFPTNAELDAMAAFQLALGRSTDPNLANLVLHGALAAQGKVIFQSAAARCNVCHFNAGATFTIPGQPPTGTNQNFATGIETQQNQPADIIDPENNRRDGGFNRVAKCTETDPAGIGNCEFNSPPLVESADTAPFFHNNSVATLEGAIAFYNSIDFRNSPSGNPQINLSQAQVDAIGAFLRVLNSLENIRSAVATGKTAKEVVNFDEAQPLLLFCVEETQDAITVLTQRGIERQAIPNLQLAQAKFKEASSTPDFDLREALIKEALEAALRARNSMSAGPFWI